VRPLDIAVLVFALAGFVAYGLWRSRGTRDMAGFLVAGRRVPWPMVALSVMATQASAVTFLATPGQGYVGGLSFVQFYFGLPLAMVVLCATIVPLYQRLRVRTAYEFLERRFDGSTRTLAAALFLLQRGLAAGITLYAPGLVLSVILGLDLRVTCSLLGLLVIGTTTLGGSKAVAHTQALQFSIIMGAMVLAFVLALRALPPGLGVDGALAVAGHLGKLQAVDTHFDPRGRYNLWAGLVGGLFLQLSYFGTDQSQVGRYLAARSTTASRLALLFNGLFKVPMQAFILGLGVLVFVTYQFAPAPLFFDPRGAATVRASGHAGAWAALERTHADAGSQRGHALDAWLAASRTGDATAKRQADAALASAQAADKSARDSAVALVRAAGPNANTNDTNYIFLHFVLTRLPIGVVGLVLAAIFAAAMNSASSEIHSLTATTIVDVVERLPMGPRDERSALMVTRAANVFWVVFAVGFSQVVGRSGSLVETVNLLGSLFYGTILGIFVTAIAVRRAGGPAVFLAALLAEGAVLACWRLDLVFWLWFNVVGCLLTVGLAALFAAAVPAWRSREKPPGGAAAA
jgi:Na+/proline symporter